MATIGLCIESGAMHSVLFDSEKDAVLASDVVLLDDDCTVPDRSRHAIETMCRIAADLGVTAQAAGLVYRSDAERESVAAVAQHSAVGTVELVAAPSAFMAWLAEAAEFRSSERVLLYHLGATGACLSLADSTEGTLSTPRTVAFESLDPEQIGSTVSVAWDIIDQAEGALDAVAVFGDCSADRTVHDILALGLGVPVSRVDNADQLPAIGAARVAAHAAVRMPVIETDHDESPAAGSPAAENTAAENSGAESSVAEIVSAEIHAEASEVGPSRVVPTRNGFRRSIPRKRVVLAAALLVGISLGGVAFAATLPAGAPERPSEIQSQLAGATQPVEPEQQSSTVPVEVGAPTAVPGAIPPAPPSPPPLDSDVPVVPVDTYVTNVPAPAPIVPSLVEVPQPPDVVANPEALVPIAAGDIPPAAAVVPSPTVEPPSLLPVIVPDPEKTTQELEHEAWAQHGEHAADWLRQEIEGNLRPTR